MENKRRRRFGDRKDGYRIRSVQPLTMMTPYFMKNRSDACNTFSDSISCTNLEKYCREKVKGGNPNFGVLHVLIAAYIRMLAEYPGANRFISGQRIFHRHKIEIAMIVKRSLTVDSPDTLVKIKFDTTDSVMDVYNKFNAEVQKNSDKDADTSFDKTARFLTYIPGLLLRWTIGFLKSLDYFGLLPMKLLDVSPFHGSMIITSMGSLGIKPIYHHLYDFGNLPVFIAYGAKRDELYMNREGLVKKKKVIDIKAVTDERICDGFYYASAFKYWKKILENPEILDNPPERILEDID